jgi:hypothetical protein
MLLITLCMRTNFLQRDWSFRRGIVEEVGRSKVIQIGFDWNLKRVEATSRGIGYGETSGREE